MALAITQNYIAANQLAVIKNYVTTIFAAGKIPQNRLDQLGVRFSIRLAACPRLPQECWDILKQLQADFSMGDARAEDPAIGWRIMVHKAGAVIGSHYDEPWGGGDIERFNIMIQKPVTGGNPTLEDVEYPVNEGDMWHFIGTQELHGATETQGGVNRILLSYGFTV